MFYSGKYAARIATKHPEGKTKDKLPLPPTLSVTTSFHPKGKVGIQERNFRGQSGDDFPPPATLPDDDAILSGKNVRTGCDKMSGQQEGGRCSATLRPPVTYPKKQFELAATGFPDNRTTDGLPSLSILFADMTTFIRNEGFCMLRRKIRATGRQAPLRLRASDLPAVRFYSGEVYRHAKTEFPDGETTTVFPPSAPLRGRNDALQKRDGTSANETSPGRRSVRRRQIETGNRKPMLPVPEDFRAC